MKELAQQMVDERTQFFQKWLTSASSHESRDNQQFTSKFLNLIQTDKLTQKIFITNLCGLLQSRQSNLTVIFQYCLRKKSKVYQQKICSFLQICLDQKNQIFLSNDMEKYIIHNIWNQNMKRFVEACKFKPIKIVEYLSLKMRSLNPQTRYSAVNALFQILQLTLQGWKSPFASIVKTVLPQMIQKQNYGKQVCYYRGVLLQILEDQYCHIKKRGIQLLGKAQSFFEKHMIRPLILYMLNDQHQKVRQTCLDVLSQIPDLDIEKQDLSALLVCLKQNNSLMRSQTYQSLSHINITSSQDFRLIIDRLLFTLSNRTEDKKKIYILCSKLGQKYPNFVISNITYIYGFKDNQQPNWKSITYRARLITVAVIGKQKWPKSLPKYFANHYLYIRDVLLYAFQSKLINTKSLKDINQQMTQTEGIYQYQVSINLVTDWQLYQFVRATEYITQGFLKSIFQIVLQYIQQTKLLRNINSQFISFVLKRLSKLEVMFNIYSMEKSKQIIDELTLIIKQSKIEKLKEFLIKIRQNQIWSRLEKIQAVIFKVSNTDKSKIVISNIPQILKRSFIQFGNSVSHAKIPQIQPPNVSNNNNAQQVGYLRMSQIDFQQINNKMCFYKIKFKCNQIRCLILYGSPAQYHVTDVFSAQDWIGALVR